MPSVPSSIEDFIANIFSSNKIENLSFNLTQEKIGQLVTPLAKQIHAQGSSPIHIALSGFLASGKTTFVRALAHALKCPDAEQVESPTFGFFHPYPLSHDANASNFVHYDLHRLPTDPELFSASLDQLDILEHLGKPGVHCIEWAERLDATHFAPNTLWIHIEHPKTAAEKTATRKYNISNQVTHARSQKDYLFSLTSKKNTPPATQSQEDQDRLAIWRRSTQNSQFMASFDLASDLSAFLKNDLTPEQSDLPQMALVGRSNVGKSSLLNALTGRKGFARVSKTPGKTRQFVIFHLPSVLNLIDLPGYGYAQVSAKEQRRWHEEIAIYFQKPPHLTLLLIDSRHGIKPSDRQMLEYFEAHRGNKGSGKLLCVLTKWDKIPSSKRRNHKKQLLKDLHGVGAVVFHRDCPQLKEQLILKILQQINPGSSTCLEL